MMKIRNDELLKAISFQLLVNLDPKARYSFVNKGYTYTDFFSLHESILLKIGFKRGNISNVRNNYIEIAEDELKRAETNQIIVISKNDERYPPLLREIFDPPVVLYILGDPGVLRNSSIAVVGSRKGNSYGHAVLKSLIPRVAEERIAIISGMAYGIDSMAHNEALRAGGITVGVNAGGLMKLYPAKNRGLSQRILKKGCIISEFPLDTVPRPFLFPIRNRIIAGLSKAILVVQAELRSGSLITARLGMEQNREVLAVPGPITDKLSSGTNYLISQGAKTVLKSDDILEEFGIDTKLKKDISISDLKRNEIIILDLIAVNEVKSIDYFVEESGNTVSETITILMGLVLKGIVVEESGGFRRIL